MKTDYAEVKTYSNRGIATTLPASLIAPCSASLHEPFTSSSVWFQDTSTYFNSIQIYDSGP